MIDNKSFGVGMGVLAERFRSALAAPAQSGYYSILSRELTTDEFEIAVQLAFRHSRFWPSPQELIDFAKPPRDLDFEAMEAWRVLYENAPNKRDAIEALGEAAVVAFRSIGGNDAMRDMTIASLPYVKRDFVKAYMAHSTATRTERQIEAARQSLPRQRRAIKSAPVSIGEVVLVEAGRVT